MYFKKYFYWVFIFLFHKKKIKREFINYSKLMYKNYIEIFYKS